MWVYAVLTFVKSVFRDVWYEGGFICCWRQFVDLSGGKVLVQVVYCVNSAREGRLREWWCGVKLAQNAVGGNNNGDIRDV